MFSKIKNYLGGILIFIVLIALYNGFFWLFEGNPLIPTVKNKYWVGHYGFENENHIWFLAYFFEHNNDLKMLMISAASLSKSLGINNSENMDFFTVSRNSNDKNYVRYKFKLDDYNEIFKADQLYEGKRYFLGPLLAGDFKNIMKINKNISISGESIQKVDNSKMIFELGIDVQDKDLMNFIDSYVLENNSIETVDELQLYIDNLIDEYNTGANNVYTK